MPVLLDFRGYGSKPFPPEIVAYRLIIDPVVGSLVILYEVYWRRQDCTWKELNKDHDHDYEQIQAHFDMNAGKMKRIIVSSVGSIEHAGHGVEVYSHIRRAEVVDVEYTTSTKEHFPWGGSRGEKNATEMREMPIGKLVFENGRPVVLVVNCYHAFTGLKRRLLPGERMELTPRLERLDRRLLERWYYRNVKNRFGHDISQPFNKPYIMYYPPPEDWKSRVVYNLLWLYTSLGRAFSR